MNILTFSLFLSAIVLQSGTIDKDPEVEKFIAEVTSGYKEVLDKKRQLRETIKAMEAGRINKTLKKSVEVIGKKYLWKSEEQKEKAVAELKRELESNDDFLPTLDFETVQIGKFPTKVINKEGVSSNYEILQIVDDNNALVKWNSLAFGPFADSIPKKVTKIIWIVLDTKGKVDGQAIEPSGTFRRTGTKRYETAAGSSNTVPVFEPFDSSKIIADLQEPIISKSKLEGKFRRWSDASSSFNVEARFISIENGIVLLEKLDGQRIKVPLDKLSANDSKWIEDHK